MGTLLLAVTSMVIFSLFVQMSEGATYAVVPFINKKALGGVAGIVGAGGNAGAVSAGFLFRSESLSTPEALMWLGVAVCVSSGFAFLVKFSPAVVEEEQKALEQALAEREALTQTKPELAAA
jgi:NNP family nitrate/nitrite transporter-like MFS transporter